MEFDEVVTPKKDVNQLSAWLHGHAVVTPISLSAFSKSFIEHLVYNAVNAITNQRVQADQNELEFVCYKLEKVADNKKYNYALRLHMRALSMSFSKRRLAIFYQTAPDCIWNLFLRKALRKRISMKILSTCNIMSFAGMNIWNCVSGTVKDNPNTDGVIIEYRSPASHSGQHPSGYKIAQKNRDLPQAGPDFQS